MPFDNQIDLFSPPHSTLLPANNIKWNKMDCCQHIDIRTLLSTKWPWKSQRLQCSRLKRKARSTARLQAGHPFYLESFNGFLRQTESMPRFPCFFGSRTWGENLGKTWGKDGEKLENYLARKIITAKGCGESHVLWDALMSISLSQASTWLKSAIRHDSMNCCPHRSCVQHPTRILHKVESNKTSEITVIIE